jgi:hypothetical protein
MNDHLHYLDYIVEWKEHIDDRGAVTFAVWITKDGQQIFYHHPLLHVSIAIEYARMVIDDINSKTEKARYEAFQTLNARIKRYEANPLNDDDNSGVPF